MASKTTTGLTAVMIAGAIAVAFLVVLIFAPTPHPPADKQPIDVATPQAPAANLAKTPHDHSATSQVTRVEAVTPGPAASSQARTEAELTLVMPKAAPLASSGPEPFVEPPAEVLARSDLRSELPQEEPPMPPAKKVAPLASKRVESAKPEFNPFQAEPPKAKIVSKKRKSGQKVPLEVIRAFITDSLSAGEKLKIWIYSNPQPVRFEGKKADVLRVVYEVRSKRQTQPKDQLFLLQDSEVKYSVDTGTWLNNFRQVRFALAAEDRVLQQGLATQLAQRPVNC